MLAVKGKKMAKYRYKCWTNNTEKLQLDLERKKLQMTFGYNYNEAEQVECIVQ